MRYASLLEIHFVTRLSGVRLKVQQVMECYVIFCRQFAAWVDKVSELRFEGVGMTSRRTRDRLVQRLRDQGVADEKILGLVSSVPRHLFLEEALSHRAYEDTALPIGYGQTLSQPYIVARMTELLVEHCSSLEKVLEIGTGSGYQTAILSQVAARVWSVERIKPLQDKARARLQQLKIYNVFLRYADGSLGLPDYAPFDGILSAAAPERVPDELKQQLAPGGALVIPVGGHAQNLVVVKRLSEGDEYEERVVEPVRFVPLISGITRG